MSATITNFMTIKPRERFNFTLLFNILYLSDAPWCVPTFVWFLCLSIGRTRVRPYIGARGSEFGGEMEFDFREIISGHLKHIITVGKEHVASLFINSHKLMIPFLECC